MPKDERKLQKKLAKKRAKELQRKNQLKARKQQLTSLAGQMAASSEGEVQHCYLGVSPTGTEANGMITVTITRSGPLGHWALANFLVDTWCLGVKDCSAGLLAPSEVRETIEELGRKMEIVATDPSTARAVLEHGVEYARSLGLRPHQDYPKANPIWGDIPVGELPLGVEFGQDGRPCYVVGPYDDSARQQRIYRSLVEHVGEGNFDFVSAQSQFAGITLGDLD